MLFTRISLIILTLLSISNCYNNTNPKISRSFKTSNNKNQGNILWRIFSKGKSYFSSTTLAKNRRNDPENEHPPFFNSFDFNSFPEEGEEPEHRSPQYAASAEHYNEEHSSGWGWTSPHYHRHTPHGNNLELYTLLGGLSFASFLATTLILLTRSNGTILRSAGENWNNYYYQGTEALEQSQDVLANIPQLVHKLLSPFEHKEPKVMSKVPLITIHQ